MTPPIREHIYEDADKQRANTNPSAYDVVPKPLTSQGSTDQDMLSESEQGRKRSKSFSPEPTLPKVREEIERQSASQEDDKTSSNLDFLPRSSPQVRVRSITPEYAQHLRKVEQEEGRQSPSTFKRSKTVHTFSHEVLPSSDTYDVPKQLRRQSPDEGVYNVPKPLTAPYDPEGTYHIPRPSADVYHVPRSQEDARNTQGHYHHPKPADQVYKVPVLASSAVESTYSVPTKFPKTQPNANDVYYSYPPEASDFTDGNGFYNVPKPSAEVDNVYKVPRSVLEEAESQTDNVYKVPKSVLSEQNGTDSIYNVPRSLSANEGYISNGARQHNSSSPPPANTYETIDTNPQPKGVLGRLRAARSFESLLGNRINTTGTPIELSGPQIAANPNLYVGVDVEHMNESPQTSAMQQQPAMVRSRAVARPENVYAEIPDDMLQDTRRPLVTDSGRALTSRSHYDTLPIRGTQLEMEGLTKAQALHDEEGYELVLPPGVREEQLRAMTLPHRPKHHGTTPPRQLPTQPRLKHIQDKYGIDRMTSRRYSEGLVLDSSSLDYASIPSETILGSSIPADSTIPALDEYVIITRQDTRPKFFNTLPQPILAGNRVVIGQGSIPSVGSDSSMSSGDKLDDSGEYELMNSARVNMARLKYNTVTPNPTLTQGSAENRQQRSSAGGVSEQYYGNTFHTVSSVGSMNSLRDSVFSDKSSEVESGSSPTTAPMQVSPKKLVRIASGSPHNASLTLDLRYVRM